MTDDREKRKGAVGERGKAEPDASVESALLDLAGSIADEAGFEDLARGDVDASTRRTLPAPTDPAMRKAFEDIARVGAAHHQAAEESGAMSDLAVSTTKGASGLVGRGFPERWKSLELEEHIGGGVSGSVYRARDTDLDSAVALKLFHQRADSADRSTLLREGRQHARVRHENIVVIHGAGESDGRVGIWMDYIEGVTLEQLVGDEGPRSPDETISIGRQLCSALAEVHRAGLTHGDVKAQNVMRQRPGGKIVLMDFSSSRPARVEDDSARLVGTPLYMAPELLEGEPSTPASDLYALGVLLFYLLTQRFPYEGRDLHDLRDAVREGGPHLLDNLRTDLPPGLSNVIRKATARRPRDRFQSAGELLQALRGISSVSSDTAAAEHPAATKTTPTTDHVSILVRTMRSAVAGAAAVAFLALLGYLNEFNFTTALQIPDRFTDYSFTNAAVKGLRSLSFIIAVGILEIAAVGVLWAVAIAIAPGATRRLTDRASDRLRSLSPQVPLGFALVSLASVVFATMAFSGFLEVAFNPTYSDADLSLLRLNDCSGETAPAVRFALTFSHLLLLLSAGWLVVFGPLKPPAVDPPLRFMKWLSALSILVGFAVMSIPWRLVWNNDSTPIEIGAIKGYVVAGDDAELFIYAPEAPVEQRRLAVRRDDPRITNLGTTPENIFGGESCEEGEPE